MSSGSSYRHIMREGVEVTLSTESVEIDQSSEWNDETTTIETAQARAVFRRTATAGITDDVRGGEERIATYTVLIHEDLIEVVDEDGNVAEDAPAFVPSDETDVEGGQPTTLTRKDTGRTYEVVLSTPLRSKVYELEVDRA